METLNTQRNEESVEEELKLLMKITLELEAELSKVVSIDKN
jgi:hypothetical protein